MSENSDQQAESSAHQKRPAKAGLLRRLAALLYDAFLVLAIWMVIGYAIQYVLGTDTNQIIDGKPTTSSFADALYFLMEVATASTFYIWFWRRTGQTLGMIAWRIKATSADGSIMTLKQAILRFVLAWPSFWCFGLGYLWMYVDTNKDALHDKYSGTQVIVLPKNARPF
ncbi:MAG: RDD family protein [Pseudohongiellaceae bacterium]|nr:RDD family protein [Pseudohongiellaceae bacterium]